jgi:hypothetical protein
MRPTRGSSTRVWHDTKLPDGKILIPAVVTSSTNVVEHPETATQRIERYADVVGRENVLAGSDCGFAQGWNIARTHQTMQWAKSRPLGWGRPRFSATVWFAGRHGSGHQPTAAVNDFSEAVATRDLRWHAAPLAMSAPTGAKPCQAQRAVLPTQ